MKIIVKTRNDLIKEIIIVSNILKYTIDDLNIVTILYKDLILKYKLDRFK